MKTHDEIIGYLVQFEDIEASRDYKAFKSQIAATGGFHFDIDNCKSVVYSPYLACILTGEELRVTEYPSFNDTVLDGRVYWSDYNEGFTQAGQDFKEEYDFHKFSDYLQYGLMIKVKYKEWRSKLACPFIICSENIMVAGHNAGLVHSVELLDKKYPGLFEPEPKPQKEKRPNASLADLINPEIENREEIAQAIKVKYKNIKGIDVAILLEALQSVGLISKFENKSAFLRACQSAFGEIGGQQATVGKTVFVGKDDLHHAKFSGMVAFLESLIKPVKPG